MTKLHYFVGRGRAETTRWMLAAVEIPFENVGIETPEELVALRATGKLPFDQLPLLEIDGLCLSQSSALIRYLARGAGLYGDNDIEAMHCDMLAGAIADFAEASLQAAFQATDELVLAMLTERTQKFAPRFEAYLERTGSGYLCTQSLSFADVVLAQATSAYIELVPNIFADYPLLQKHQAKITSLPGIKAYLDSDLYYPTPGDAYVTGVARVLQRALPGHMPDPNRFVAA